MLAEGTAAKLLPLISPVATALANASKGKIAKKIDELRVLYRQGFEAFVRQSIDRFSFVKTILGSSAPVSFEDIYVNLKVCENRNLNGVSLRDDDFLRISQDTHNIVFTATAGAGKSMLMRHLFFLFLREQTARLPIFLELRELNDNPDVTLVEHIRERIQEHISGFTLDQTRFAFQEGLLVLFLDGFDEVDHDRRAKRSREIRALANKFPSTILFVSGRPDETFHGWERFHIYHVKPFTEAQVRLLIDKVPYDNDIKELFRKKLDQGLFSTHKEFLVNPLLTLMMLITLEQFAEVPSKIHLFYEYAFEALFSKHDATKAGAFHRKRYVTLALDDYRRLFSYFCTVSYVDEAFRFSEIAALEYLDRSTKASQIVVDKNSMLSDLEHCTCMLARDGLELVFSHRSFQEYFVAFFFARVKGGDLGQAAAKLLLRGNTDSVMLMISEMNKERFEETWALPQLERMYALTKDIDASSDPINFALTLHETDSFGVRIEDDNILFIETPKRNSRSISASAVRHSLYKIYEMFDVIHARVQKPKDGDANFVQMWRSGELALSEPLRIQHRSANRDFAEGRVTRADGRFFASTYAGRFFAEEQRQLNRLLGEVRERVEARKNGLASILGV